MTFGFPLGQKYHELWTKSLELLQFFNNPKRRSTPYFLW